MSGKKHDRKSANKALGTRGPMIAVAKRCRIYKRLGFVLGINLLAGSAFATLIDFEGYSSGTIIDNEYLDPFGVVVNAVNIVRGNTSNVAVIFDTANPTGGDWDLGGPFTSLTSGILDPGNVLIIHERPSSCNGVSCTNPDDEGSRGAGYFEFIFPNTVTINSIDFFDIEAVEGGRTAYNAINLYDSAKVEIFPTFYTPTTGGDNTWSRLLLGTSGIRSLRINMGGSGAIDNINYTATNPEPVPGEFIFQAATGNSNNPRQCFFHR